MPGKIIWRLFGLALANLCDTHEPGFIDRLLLLCTEVHFCIFISSSAPYANSGLVSSHLSLISTIHWNSHEQEEGKQILS